MSVRCVSTAGQSHDNHCTILVGKGKLSVAEGVELNSCVSCYFKITVRNLPVCENIL